MIDKNDFRYRVRLVEYARKYGTDKAAEMSGYSEDDVRLIVELYESQGPEALKGPLRLSSSGEGQGVKPKAYNISDRLHQSLFQFYVELVKDLFGMLRGGPAAIYGGAWRALGSFIRHAVTGQKRQAKFIVPSVVLHLLLLALLGFISGIDISSLREYEEDFTFVDLSVYEQPVAMPEQPEAVEEGEPAAQPAPAAAPRREVETASPGRESSAARGVELPEETPSGQRGAEGEKQRVALEAGEAAPADESSLESRLAAAEKTFETAGTPGSMQAPDVKFTPRDIAMSAAGDVSEARRGPETRSVGGKAAGEARGPQVEGIEASGPSGAKDAVSGGKAAAKLEAARPGAEGMPEFSPEGRSEPGAVSVFAGRPGKKPATGDVIARAPGKLDISVGESKPGPAGARAGGQGVKSLEKSSTAASSAATADGFKVRAGAGEGGLSTGSKRTGRLGAEEAEGEPGGGAVPEFAPGTGRRAGIESAAPRRFASSDAALAPRKLDIHAGGGRPGASPQAGSPKGSAAGPARHGEKAASRPSAGVAEGTGTLAGSSGGYSTAGSGGKGVDAGALSSGGGGAGAPSLGTSGAEKQAGVAGTPGRAAGPAIPEAKPSRGGGLAGLIKSTVSSLLGTGGKGGSTGKGEGVKLGTGEKGASPAPVAVAAAKPSGTGAGKEVLAGDKEKAAGGTLGVPGGKGKERYASAGKTKAGPIAPEKMSGVSGRPGRKSFGPSVKIISPGPGETTQISQTVSGLVSDLRARKVTITVNDDTRVVSVVNGRFDTPVALKEGKNVITAMAFDPEGNVGKDQVSVRYTSPSGGFDVNITEPKDGQVFDVSRGNTVKVRGVLGDSRVTTARMIFNGSPKDIIVKNGSFTQDVALTQEQNAVVVEAVGPDGRVSSSRTVRFTTVNVTPKDIMIVLTWDKPKADFDLHVYDPQGGHTSYKSPNVYESNEAIVGGQLEQDAKGNFGPEVFTQEEAARGTYSIKSNYYYSGGDGDAMSTVTVILYGDNPARRIVRVFGPHLQKDTRTGEEVWDVARFKMPEGIFLED